MSSSKSSQKPTGNIYSSEISPFELFYQLAYMSTTAAAEIPRPKVFEIAQKVDAIPSKFFQEIGRLTDKMRYNYPDACRMVGERVKEESMRSVLFRLSDALRSGEPIAGFLIREANAQGEGYSSTYQRDLESLKKWNDGYTSVMVSVALIVIINMVSTMIYDLGVPVMAGMTFTAIIIGFIVAWVISRAAPKETISVPWAVGSPQQVQAHKLSRILLPVIAVVAIILIFVGLPLGWTFIAIAAMMMPLGILAWRAEGHVDKKDQEVAAFFRSLGGTATSRGTTLGKALEGMELDSFPAMREDIVKLTRRLKAGAKPAVCWAVFGRESGSSLINQTAGMFFAATNLGGDPEKTGMLCSMFASKVATARAYRKGVAATFVWLALVMYVVLSALMVFILEILKQFIKMIEAALTIDEQQAATSDLASRMLAFNMPETDFLGKLALALIVMMAITNAFAMVASEGSKLMKMTFYLSAMFGMAGVALLVVPPLVASIVV